MSCPHIPARAHCELQLQTKAKYILCNEGKSNLYISSHPNSPPPRLYSLSDRQPQSHFRLRANQWPHLRHHPAAGALPPRPGSMLVPCTCIEADGVDMCCRARLSLSSPYPLRLRAVVQPGRFMFIYFHSKNSNG